MAESVSPVASLSDTKLFKYRNYELVVQVPRAWRDKYQVSQNAIVRAACNAKICHTGTSEPLLCPKCGKILSIRASRSVPPENTPVERYVFAVRSRCTSSRDHLKSSLVIMIDGLPTTEPVFTKPFIIQARVKVHHSKKAAAAAAATSASGAPGPSAVSPPHNHSDRDQGSSPDSNHSDQRQQTPPEANQDAATAAAAQSVFDATVAQYGQGLDVVPANASALVGSPIVETRLLNGAIHGYPRMLARFVQTTLDRDQFSLLVSDFGRVVNSRLGLGFTAIRHSFVSDNVVFVVTSYQTICDAVQGNMLCGQVTRNLIANRLNIDLTALVHFLSTCSSW